MNKYLELAKRAVEALERSARCDTYQAHVAKCKQCNDFNQCSVGAKLYALIDG